jgi:hypothetical protein
LEPEYVIAGRRQVIEEAKLEFCVHLMDLTSDDKHSMQLNPDYVPSPTVNERLSSRFHIPMFMNIAYESILLHRSRCALRQFPRFHQILENEKLLLILLDRERVSIYIDHLHAMDLAIRRERSIKNLNREKLGDDVLFAFDEAKRSLAVCASTKVCFLLGILEPWLTVLAQLQLHVFVFDESYRTLQAQGTAINFAPWYSQTEISILHTAFVCGNEEIVLVDSSSQARIFSFVTLQFRCHLPFPQKYLVTDPSEGPLLYNFHPSPALYSRLLMALAFLFITLKARSHSSPRIIGKHSDQPQGFA